MGRILAFTVGSLLLFAFLVSYFSPEAADARAWNNYVQSERDLLALERAEQWHELNQQHAPALAVGQTVLALGSMALLLAGGATLLLALWNWAQGIQHDRRFQMEQLRSQERVLVAQAAHQHPLPAQHYAPHITYSPHTTSKAIPGDTAPVPAATEPALAVPSFSDLLTNGLVGQGQPLILGYGSTGAIYGDWRDLYSTGIGGISGSGKSWTAAYLIGQSALHGANIAILDPHAGDSESLSTRLSPLAGRFLCEPADSPKAMLDVVKMMFSEYERRKQHPKEPRVPWIIACDEFSSLMRGELEEALSLLFEAIAQEGRKFEIYGMALGQIWTVSRAGGSEVRDSLASQYVHRLRPAQARHLTGLTSADLPKDLLELPPGTCYLMSNSGDLRRVSIPRCSGDDLATVAGLLADDLPTMPRVVSAPVSSNGQNGTSPFIEMPDQPDDNRTVNGHSMSDKPNDTAAEKANSMTPQAAHILALARAATPISKIVEDVWGSKGGPKYKERAAEVMRVISENLRERAVGE